MGRRRRSKSTTYVAGYRYYCDVHFVLCHGPVDGIDRIKVGEKNLPVNTYRDRHGIGGQMIAAITKRSSRNYSTRPFGIREGNNYANGYNLFGGEDGEGGVEGYFDVLHGGPHQQQNAHLRSILGYNVPAFRHVCSVVLKKFMICAMSPYPKPWRFRVIRQPKTFNYAPINGNEANPAGIIAECWTNTSFGLGLPAEDLDKESFDYAAEILKNESFGLSLLWSDQQSISDFLEEHVLKVIDGQVFSNPRTGKLTLKLLRDDYDVNKLPVLSPDNVLSVEDCTRPAATSLINSVTIVYVDKETGQEKTITEQSAASLAMGGGINSITLYYRGITNESLARRIALRELVQAGRGVTSCTIMANREASNIYLGDCFILNWPELGIEKMVMRAVSISYGKSDDWRIVIQAVEDVFSLPTTVLAEESSKWEPPTTLPVNVSVYRLMELPRLLVSYFITDDESYKWNELPEGYGFIYAMAQQPSGATVAYNAMVYHKGEWEISKRGSFNGHGVLVEEMTDVCERLNLEVGSYIEYTMKNALILVDEEFMLYTSSEDGPGTVKRGCLDTVPTSHKAGSVVWIIGDQDGTLPTVYLTGVNETVKFQSIGLGQALPVDSSPSMDITMANRAARPIAPARVIIDGAYRPKALNNLLHKLSWARRDKLNTAGITDQSMGDQLPETGTSTTVRISQKMTENDAWSITKILDELETTSLNLKEHYNEHACALKLELWSVKDDLTSWQTQEIITYQSGYGLNYGQYYGGI